MSLFAAGNAAAADCGCETPCDALPMEMTGCDGGCSHSHHGNAFSENLRKLQNRFKKLCDVNWSGWKFGGHGDPMCDDACDAAMMEDLMMPSPAFYQNQPMPPHIHSHPHSASRPEMLPEVHFPPADSKTIAPPVHTHEKALDAELFQSLPDPFTDDEVRLQTQSTVRPSNHVELVLRPVPRRPLSQSQESSSRRVKSVR